MPVRVDCLLLADAAQEATGKLYVLGGGWNRLRVAALPAQGPTMALALRVVVPWHDTNQPLSLTVHLEDPDGRRLLAEPPRIDLAIGRPPGLPPGSEQAVPLALALSGFPLRVAGTHAFLVTLDERELARTTFDVVVARQ